MPAGIVLDKGKTHQLDDYMAFVPIFASNFRMGLLVGSPLPPFDQTTDGDVYVLANEAFFPGYGRQSVSFPGASILTPDHHALTAATPVTFLNAGPGASPLITGWFYLDAGVPRVLVLGVWDTPFIMPPVSGFSCVPTWRYTGE
jgi:hypothetical protein